MPRTPDEIKKGLECCSVDDLHCGEGCPYKDDCLEEARYKGLESDALAYIQQLEAENTRRHEKIIQLYNDLENLHDIVTTIVTDSKETYKQLEAERDAAVADIRFAFTSYVGACQTCKHGENQVDCIEPIRCPDCENEKCKCQSCDGDFRNWEWRGVQKEDMNE